jgi:hypothetical protein
MKVQRLAKSKRIELRRLKSEIRKASATKVEANEKIRELVSKTYKKK